MGISSYDVNFSPSDSHDLGSTISPPGSKPRCGLDVSEPRLLQPGSLPHQSYYNCIILAEYWGFTYDYFGQLTGVRDAELIERELAIVLKGEIGDWPFWHRQAKIAAERLLTQLREMTD